MSGPVEGWEQEWLGRAVLFIALSISPYMPGTYSTDQFYALALRSVLVRPWGLATSEKAKGTDDSVNLPAPSPPTAVSQGTVLCTLGNFL